jgi:hypothetical protein
MPTTQPSRNASAAARARGVNSSRIAGMMGKGEAARAIAPGQHVGHRHPPSPVDAIDRVVVLILEHPGIAPEGSSRDEGPVA